MIENRVHQLARKKKEREYVELDQHDPEFSCGNPLRIRLYSIHILSISAVSLSIDGNADLLKAALYRVTINE